jgi:hypothetical protein
MEGLKNIRWILDINIIFQVMMIQAHFTRNSVSI